MVVVVVTVVVLVVVIPLVLDVVVVAEKQNCDSQHTSSAVRYALPSSVPPTENL